MNAIATQLETLVTPENVTRFDDLEPSQQARIAQSLVPGTKPDCIVYPRTQTELAEVIQLAKSHHWRILPCGSGSKLTWGGLGEGVNLVVSTQRLNQVIEHAVGDLTVTVEAGMKFADLQQILAESGQFLAFDPAYPEHATMGGIVATADTGSWRQGYGGVRDRLIGFSFVRTDGQIAKAGGRVVKNVAGYDLMKLFIGSYGTLGIISQVTFRLYPFPPDSRTVILTGKLENIAQATQILLTSALTPTACDWVLDQKGISLVTRFQSISESVNQQAQRLLEVGKALSLEGTVLEPDQEANLWKRLPEQIWQPSLVSGIICKIGIKPTEAAKTLKLLAESSATALIHAKTGLGLVRWNEISIPQLQEMRSHLNQNAGFLTILEAPVSLKQQLDVWGYTGNAVELMRQLKQKFDPDYLLSPHRFVGGI